MRTPFRIDRTSARTLTEQLTDGLRTAIFAGEWRKEGKLPSQAEIASRFGVSDNIVRAAIAALTKEGLIRPRRRLGCKILHRRGKRIFGRILYVLPEDAGSYPTSVFAQSLRETLDGSGINCTSVCVPGGAHLKPDWTQLRQELRRNYDLALVWGSGASGPSAVRMIERAGLSYFCFNGLPDVGKRGVACFPHDDQTAVSALVRDCVRAHVHSVCCCGFSDDGLMVSLVRELKAAGIFTEQIVLSSQTQRSSFETVQCAAHEAVTARLGRGPMCNLIFFSDDYLLAGGLVALLEKDVRIPQDIRLVSVRNLGAGPVFSRSFASFLYDMAELARRVGAAAVEYLRTGTVTSAIPFGPRYVRGETFPVS